MKAIYPLSGLLGLMLIAMPAASAAMGDAGYPMPIVMQADLPDDLDGIPEGPPPEDDDDSDVEE